MSLRLVGSTTLGLLLVSDTRLAAIRHAAEVRSLALKNADAKAVAAAAARTVSKTITVDAHPAQRGFVARGDLAANMVEMDAYARRNIRCESPGTTSV